MSLSPSSGAYKNPTVVGSCQCEMLRLLPQSPVSKNYRTGAIRLISVIAQAEEKSSRGCIPGC